MVDAAPRLLEAGRAILADRQQIFGESVGLFQPRQPFTQGDGDGLGQAFTGFAGNLRGERMGFRVFDVERQWSTFLPIIFYHTIIRRSFPQAISALKDREGRRESPSFWRLLPLSGIIPHER